MKRAILLLATAGASQAQTSNQVLRLAPPYAELPMPFWEQYGVLIIIGSVVALAVVAGAIWVALRPRPVPPEPTEVLARRELLGLQARVEDGDLLSRVSQVFRRYVAAAFNLGSGEATTAEFCRVVRAAPAIGEELATAIADFLQTCDLRKFAPVATGTPPLNAVARALELVERAEARRRQLTAAVNQPNA